MKRFSTWKSPGTGLLAACLLFFVGGIELLSGTGFRQPFLSSGWLGQGPGDERPGAAPDGPLLFYRNGLLISKQINPQGAALTLSTDTIRDAKAARFTCFVEETGGRFSFPLHPIPASEPSVYDVPEKMLVFSDIEGNFKGLQLLLQKSGVVDERLAWQFGKGHLMIVGDSFDRGRQVTECLWLFYKLEEEARLAGGKVHFLMGNHDQMNLRGNFRYVRRKYGQNADTLREPYGGWYDENTELGRWLRSKNIAERIGKVLFVHAGISPEVAQERLSLDEMNRIARQGLRATSEPQSTGIDQLIIYSELSPTWYRGLAQEQLTAQQVKTVLKAVGAQQMVIGHTILGRIKPLYDNRVIAIDLEHQKSAAAGYMQALWTEGGKMFVFDTRTGKQELK